MFLIFFEKFTVALNRQKDVSLLNSYQSLVGKNINLFNNHFKNYSLDQHLHYKHTKTL